MLELFVMALFGLGIYIFARKMEKKPILPWKEQSVVQKAKVNNKSQDNDNKHQVELDEEPSVFTDLIKDLKEIDNHMIRYHDNKFVLIAEVDPVNYFLLSQDEQEAIDVTFERWLAQINYNVQFYLQNRYIDLSEPIESMQQNMKDAEDLSENSLRYGQSMIEELVRWQSISPRYETKRFLLFTYTVNSNDITADDEQELEEKIVDKAFGELYRRFNTAKSQLRKARMEASLLTSEGIGELLYHTFNRRKAVKNKYKDAALKEILALYATADQDDIRVELVKEGLEDEIERKDATETGEENFQKEEEAS